MVRISVVAVVACMVLSCTGGAQSPTERLSEKQGIARREQALADRRASEHKVQATPEQAQALVSKGAKVIADYGAFSLLTVTDAQLAKADPGLSMRDEYDTIELNSGTIETKTAAAHSS